MIKQNNSLSIIEALEYADSKNENEAKLKKYIEKGSNMGEEEQKKFHKEVLINSELYGKHGANLGLINMARKSHKKFEYDFTKLDDKYFFFSFEISISTISD